MKTLGSLSVGWLAFALLGGLGGCNSSSDDGDGGTASEAVPFEDVPELYAAALCGAYGRCIGQFFDVFLQGEDCLVRTTRRLKDDWPRFEEGIDAGRIVYRGDEVDACLDAIDAWTCDDLLERSDTSCDDVLSGTIQAGAYCAMNEECAGEQYCKFGAECPGTCSERETAGGACQSDSDCASGLVCSRVTERCEEPAGPGDLCQQGEPECAPGYICAGANDDENVPGNCRTYSELFSRGLGESCDIVAGTLCEDGAVCRIDAVLPALVSTCAERVGAGEACNLSFPSACPSGQYCDIAESSIAGTCKPRPAAGEACGRELDSSVCAAYARCDGATCRPLAYLGEPCTDDEVCYSEHCVNGKCAPSEGCE